ncbi:MAG: biosynthetic-type acetolactate synthase large subunit [Planctomycetaceae bacterium]|nr:biosynthetic-type acetolactate synthase large subunit [Planctomycetaceae bacterium]
MSTPCNKCDKCFGNASSDLSSMDGTPMSGADIVVQSLINAGIDCIFAYPGGQSIPLHQALTRYRDKLRVVLPRHEQGGGFAAQGYARSTGKIGVCMSTSGPGATNLITTIADAKLDSVAMLVITGQVGTGSIGSDAFQETPMVEVCRSITKHHYLVTNIKDLARIMKEAIYVTTTGRPGPVLVDVPRDVQVGLTVPDYNAPMRLPGYNGVPETATFSEISPIVELIQKAKRPVIYCGGGVIIANATDELLKLAERTQIPVTTTLTALSAFPREHDLSLGMLGMHGTAYANHAIHECDLLLAFGVRFDDRVTGKVNMFAHNAKIVHIDIDPSEINKIKRADLTIVSDLKSSLTTLLRAIDSLKTPLNPSVFDAWHEQIANWKRTMPLHYNVDSNDILPQYAIEELWKATKDRDCVIATGVGQHQMWASQFYKISKPRTWLTSAGLGTMGFGLPAAMGAKVANPNKLVIDIDGDGSFQMNIQEMATCYCEKIPVKVLLLNNQHLGMVVQWEDRFHKSNRAHTYLGPIDHPEWLGKGVGISPETRYPDYAAIAKGYQWEALTVSNKKDLPDAIRQMVNSDRPFLLDVAVSYREHVLPMTPAGGTILDMIQ